ncbi:NAD(P)-binding protein [Acephala macrosclerotiorum]|nr:NAD(P)-binding protein [Acephala macrosclerotiorum]
MKCDVTKWEDQVQLFAEAASFTGKVDYAVANAGIYLRDEVFTFLPTKPDLTTVDVNLKGTLYTTKLALHYFIQQNGETPSPQQEDTCLVLIGSGAAFLDCLRGSVYPSTKCAVSGIMHSLRRTAFYYGSRVNVISPWYVTSLCIIPSFLLSFLINQHMFEPISYQKKRSCLLRILSDRTINGKSLFVLPRKWAEEGYLDLDVDDYPGNAVI